MTITVDNFLTRYPVFDGEDEEVIDLTINDVYLDLPSNIWIDETIRDRAASLLTAHKLRLERGDNIMLGTALKTMDENQQLRNDYLNSQFLDRDGDEYYKLTIYGKEFLKLRRRIIAVSMFVV